MHFDDFVVCFCTLERSLNFKVFTLASKKRLNKDI